MYIVRAIKSSYASYFTTFKPTPALILFRVLREKKKRFHKRNFDDRDMQSEMIFLKIKCHCLEF
jgi:hypothetical protein